MISSSSPAAAGSTGGGTVDCSVTAPAGLVGAGLLGAGLVGAGPVGAGVDGAAVDGPAVDGAAPGSSSARRTRAVVGDGLEGRSGLGGGHDDPVGHDDQRTRGV